MKRALAHLAALLLAWSSVARATDELVVYPPVPGLAASGHYKVRVRSVAVGSEWRSAFAWETACKTIEKKTEAYFETAGPVEVEIARVNPVIAGEDWTEIHCEFVDGATGFTHGGSHTGPVPAPVAMGTMVVCGDAGTLHVTPDGHLFLNNQELAFTPPTTGYKGDSVLATQEHLLTSLRSGQRAESEGRAHLRTVALVEECYQKAPLC